MKGHSIVTYTGRRFYYDFLGDPDQICIEDIAHALSQLCRYTGQCIEFYSVGQHSIYASYLIDEKYAKAALLHDAAEAYFNDIPKPLKPYIPEYDEMEKQCMRTIFRKYGLDPDDKDMYNAVKEVDNRLQRTERRDLSAIKPKIEEGEVYDFHVCPRGVAEVKQTFLKRFAKLHKKTGVLNVN